MLVQTWYMLPPTPPKILLTFPLCPPCHFSIVPGISSWGGRRTSRRTAPETRWKEKGETKESRMGTARTTKGNWHEKSSRRRCCSGYGLGRHPRYNASILSQIIRRIQYKLRVMWAVVAIKSFTGSVDSQQWMGDGEARVRWRRWCSGYCLGRYRR